MWSILSFLTIKFNLKLTIDTIVLLNCTKLWQTLRKSINEKSPFTALYACIQNVLYWSWWMLQITKLGGNSWGIIYAKYRSQLDTRKEVLIVVVVVAQSYRKMYGLWWGNKSWKVAFLYLILNVFSYVHSYDFNSSDFHCFSFRLLFQYELLLPFTLA